MAREEQDREDLLAEATALVQRAELRVDHEPESVVIGFRRNGSGSIFFGGEASYQFNALNQLRRAFAQGQLYKAEHGRLVALSRHRTEQETQLVRQDLSPADQEEFLQAAQARLAALADSLQSGQYSVLGQVPAEIDVLSRIKAWLDRLGGELKVAATPRVG
jgi:hypothetical protein